MPPAPRITLLTRVALPVEMVFKMWIEPLHIQRWWAGNRGRVWNVSIDARVGGSFWMAVTLPDGRGVDDFGKFTEVLRGEVLAAEWEHGNQMSALVVQLLALKGGITEITLTHREFPDERTRDFQLVRWQDAMTAFGDYAAKIASELRQ